MSLLSLTSSVCIGVTTQGVSCDALQPPAPTACLHQRVPQTELSERCRLTARSCVSVEVGGGGGANKRTFDGVSVWGAASQQCLGPRYSHKEKDTALYQQKCHICTVEQEVFGKTYGSIRRTEFKSNFRPILKTKIHCTIFRAMIFAR